MRPYPDIILALSMSKPRAWVLKVLMSIEQSLTLWDRLVLDLCLLLTILGTPFLGTGGISDQIGAIMAAYSVITALFAGSKPVMDRR